MRTNRALNFSAATLTVITLSLTLAGCSDDADHDVSSMSSDTNTASNGDVFNQADVDFATNMIPHHAQAILMVTLTDGRRLDPEVEELAAEIRAAQVPEVETMADWLQNWGEEVPETSMDHVNGGHDMGAMSESDDMPGMMSAEDMQALQNASELEFQDVWLEMMKEHHEGAIEMAHAEQAGGKFTDAVELADAIVVAQEAEIEQIDQLLGH